MIARKWVLAFALVSGGVAAHSHPAANAPATEDVDAAAQEAARAVDAFGAAIHAGKIQKAADWLAPDLLVLESGGAERSRDQYLAEHAAADAAFLADARVERGHRVARASGDMAWVGTESTVTRTVDGKATRYLSTETMVLRRGREGWKIVHIHWSSRADKAAPAN